MKTITIVISLILLCSCAKEIPPDWAVPYLNAFKYEASIRGRDVDLSELKFSMVDFLDRNAQVIGKCHETGLVEIKKSFWKTASDTKKEILIFHELGHCALNKRHTKTGIMQPYLMGEDEYLDRRQILLDELFSFGTIYFLYEFSEL